METITTSPQVAAQVTVVTFPTMRWSAVFAGWLVATGLAFIMYVLGLAVGFSAVDATDLTASARSFGIGTALWMVLTWAVSLFLGGMFASWLDGTPDRTIGSLHGVAVWALATTVSVIMVALGFSNVVQGGASLLKGGAAVGMAAAAGGTQTGSMLDGPTAGLQADVKHRVAEALARSAQQGPSAGAPPRAAAGGTADAQLNASTASSADAQNASSPENRTADTQTASAGAGQPASPTQSADAARSQVSSADMRRAMEQVDAQATAAVATELMRGNTEAAKSRLAAGTTLSRAEVDQVVQGMGQQVDRAKARAKEVADKTAGYTSAALWAMFISSLIALIAAMLGGWMGGDNMRRVYDRDIVT